MKRTKRTIAEQTKLAQVRASFPEHDIARIRGQYHIARALEVAAFGQHNLVLTGSPGVGKAMLARVLPTFLPERETAYRFTQPQPDDETFSLAETDVLFLRDMHLFHVRALTQIWQKLARKAVPIQLVATFEPCPCGYFGDPVRACQCPAQRVAHHQRRYAPFLNGFAIHVEVPLPKPTELLDTHEREDSAMVRARVEAARAQQERRYADSGLGVNAAASTLDRAQDAASLDSSAQKLLEAALRQLHLSPQSTLQILRVSRTIADLAGSENVAANHLAEAIQYRPCMQR